MNEKERIRRIFSHGEPDRPACLCPGDMMNMVTSDLMEAVKVQWPQAHMDPEMMAKLAAASYEKQCFENIGVPFCMTVEAEALGTKVNMGTCCFEPHVENYAINSVSQWTELPRANFYRGRGNVTLRALRILKEAYPEAPIVGNITGPVSTASSLMEPTVFYKELRKKTEQAHAFLGYVTKHLIEFANEQIQADSLSFDSVVSMKEARANLPARILMGNVSTYALEFGDEEKIMALTKHCVDSGAGLIAPACGLGTRSPIGNIRAMLKALQRSS